MGRDARKERRRERRRKRRERREERRDQIKKGLKQVAKGVGSAMAGPVASVGKAAKAKRSGATNAEALGTFVGSHDPTSPARDIHEGASKVNGAVIEAVTGSRKAGDFHEAAGNIGAQPLGGGERSVKDVVRAAKGAADADRSMKARLREFGEGLGAGGMVFAGDTLATAADFAQATDSESIPVHLEAGIRRVFGDSLDLSDVRWASRPFPGNPDSTATASPTFIWLGRSSPYLITEGTTSEDDSAEEADPSVPNIRGIQPLALTAKERERYDTPQFIPSHLLIHELTHIWQYQHSGSDGMLKALAEQCMGEEYDWEADLDEFGPDWDAWRLERQAEFVEWAARQRLFSVTEDKVSPGGDPTRGVDLFNGRSLSEHALTGFPGVDPNIHQALERALKSIRGGDALA